MTYEVVDVLGINVSGAISKLEERMNEYLKGNCKPVGGVSVVKEDSDVVYACQAVVKGDS